MRAWGAGSQHFGREGWLLRLAAAASVVAVWAVCRGYRGIQHDAWLYVGRALADLHPHALGSEIDFAHDGQSAFSIVNALMYWTIALLGTAQSAILLTVLGLALWLIAAASFLSHYLRGAALWISLIALAALPGGYGGHSIFEIAEPFVTPRLFSEAMGLAALAALVRGRKLAAFAFIAMSALLHPIMAIPIAVVGFVVLVSEDRRWIAAPVFGIIALVIGDAFNAPIISRMTEEFDPIWLNVITIRSPHLFPRFWLLKDWASCANQLASLGIVSWVSRPPIRNITTTVIMVTIVGIAVTAIFPSVLIMQAQPWRAQWLAAFLAPATLVLATKALHDRGENGKAAVPLLLLAWLSNDNLSTALVCYISISILLLFPALWKPPRIVTRCLWFVWGFSVAVEVTIKLVAQIRVNSGVYEIYSGLWNNILTPPLQAATLIALAPIGIQNRFLELPPFKRNIIVAISFATAAFAVVTWDGRSSYTRTLEAGAGAQALRTVIPTGSVLWFGGQGGESWLWIGRPAWLADYSGAGVVFDRALALEWKRRNDALANAGLRHRTDLVIQQRERDRSPLIVNRTTLHNLCGQDAAPEWVVVPIGDSEGDIPRRLVPKRWFIWQAPAPMPVYSVADGALTLIRDYGVFSCSKGAASARALNTTDVPPHLPHRRHASPRLISDLADIGGVGHP